MYDQYLCQLILIIKKSGLQIINIITRLKKKLTELLTTGLWSESSPKVRHIVALVPKWADAARCVLGPFPRTITPLPRHATSHAKEMIPITPKFHIFNGASDSQMSICKTGCVKPIARMCSIQLLTTRAECLLPTHNSHTANTSICKTGEGTRKHSAATLSDYYPMFVSSQCAQGGKTFLHHNVFSASHNWQIVNVWYTERVNIARVLNMLLFGWHKCNHNEVCASLCWYCLM